MRYSKLIALLIGIGLFTTSVMASLNPPTSWSRGTKTYLNYTDMMNETGLRNGSISNITWIGFRPEKISDILQLCPTSAVNNATLCYNQTSNNLTISYSGSVFHRILDNRTTANPLPNVSLPLSAANISKSNIFSVEQSFSTVIVGDTTDGSTATSVGGSNKFAVSQSVSKLHNRSHQLTAFFGSNDSTAPLGISMGINGSTSDNLRWSYLDSSEINSIARPLVLQGISGGKVVVGGYLIDEPLSKLQIMGLTSSTGTTIVADAVGNIYLLTSSEVGKRNISIVTDSINWARLQNVPIKQYEYTTKNLTKNQAKSIGFTVESLYDAGLYELINFDNEGKPFSIKYDVLAVYQQGQINSLSSRVQKLEDTVIIDKKLINYLYNHFNLTKP